MLKILLLETDSLLATNLLSFFSHCGYETEWQVDPQVAVLSADKTKPDLIILDLLLATHSGVEFLYEFRSYADWVKVPIIVFSNVSQRELGSSALALEQLGVTAFHYKPQTTLKQLVSSVNQILKPIGV
jgi:DNA-binding response OmpR family regulator